MFKRSAMLLLCVLAQCTVKPPPIDPAPPMVEDDHLGWRDYHFKRFSLSLRYPAKLFSHRVPSINSDGVESVMFDINDDGASFGMLALNIKENVSPYEILCDSGCPNQAYKQINATRATVAGAAQTTLYYHKCIIVGATTVHCFSILYPATDRERYNAIAQQISESLH